MITYEKHITVTEDDLDELNHVNNVRYVQWVQDIAKEHWELLATDEIKNDFFWVMINHFIEYKGEALLNEVIKLKTYVLKTEGVTSTRIVEIFNSKTNKLITRSVTNWCLLNTKTKRPARITEDLKMLFH